MDDITLSELIDSSITAISTFVTALHLRKVNICCCVTSECSTKSIPVTPIEKKPLLQ
jgi:hypothetical protein